MQTLSLSSSVRFRTIDGDGIVVQMDSSRVIVVNHVGLHIIEKLATPIAREELLTSISEEFDVSVEQANIDLQVYLKALDQEQILVQSA